MKKLLKNKNLLFVVVAGLILALAFFVRIYNLDSVPKGFHIDEAIIADNANSILKTGKDTNGNFLPLQTEQFGDYNPTGYSYLDILPIKLFGMTIFAARIVAVVMGVLAVFSVMVLAYAFFESRKISILASLLFALSPWDIMFSRTAEETGVSIFFMVLGFGLLLLGVKREKIKYILFSTLLLFISYFMYFTPRLFVPLMFLAFLLPIKFWISKRKKLFTKVFVLCFIFLGLTAVLLVFGARGGENRFNQVSIFGFPQTKLIMAEQIREDGVQHTPVTLTRTFHNKPLDYSFAFIQNYFQYFTGDFLFVQGGLPIWFRVPGMGLIYLVELPFILFGIYCLFKEKPKWAFLILGWVLLAPVISSLTVDDIPNVRRALIMAPAIELIAAFGFLRFTQNIPKKYKKITVIVILAIFSFNSLYFFHQLFVHQPVHKNWYRNDGFGEMLTQVKKDYPSYDEIVVTKSEGGIYPLVLFYTNYDPALYLSQGHPKDKTDTGFGKFFFVDNACPFLDRDPKVPNIKKTIYVENGNCRDDKKLDSVKYTNIYNTSGVKVFRIVYD